MILGTGVGVDIVNSCTNSSSNKPVNNTTSNVENVNNNGANSNSNSNNNNNGTTKNAAVARKKKRRFAADMQTTRFSDVYSLTGEILGRGAYGQVFTCRNIYTGAEYAVKIIDKYTHPNRERVFKEIEIYLHCRECANILKIIEFFEGLYLSICIILSVLETNSRYSMLSRRGEVLCGVREDGRRTAARAYRAARSLDGARGQCDCARHCDRAQLLAFEGHGAQGSQAREYLVSVARSGHSGEDLRL